MTLTTESLTPGVEILHLDEMGYGPNGSMTRRAWRKACWDNLVAGEDAFTSFQVEVLKTHNKAEFASFGLTVDGINKFDALWQTSSSCTMDFAAHVFSVHLNILSFEFLLPCNFNYSIFSDYVWLDDAIFNRTADFEGTTFNEDVDFEGVNFKENTNFKYARFCKKADLKNVIFGGNVSFRGANFVENVEFSSATFSFNAGFQSTTYYSNARFGNAEFKGDSYFHGARFEKICHFENAIFKRVGHFEGARFNAAPPSFRGVDIATTRLEFSDENYFPRDSNTEQAVDDISFLKRLSDEHGQTDQALNFNAMELRAKRLLPDADWGFKAVTWMYEVVSDFGRSYIRPLMFYVILIWLSFLYSFGYSNNTTEKALSNNKICVNDLNILNLSREQAAFEYAMFRASGVMDFTDTGKQNNSVNCKLFDEPIEPPLMRAWGVFKGIASIALLFLAALGLRNKYRIK